MAKQPGKPRGHTRSSGIFLPAPVASVDGEQKADGGGLASECGHADPRGVPPSPPASPQGIGELRKKEAQERQNQ